VCVPGSTSDCQTIDHVLVDTGSTGLHLIGSVLTLLGPAARCRFQHCQGTGEESRHPGQRGGNLSYAGRLHRHGHQRP
jgi:hypothetical protein